MDRLRLMGNRYSNYFKSEEKANTFFNFLSGKKGYDPELKAPAEASRHKVWGVSFNGRPMLPEDRETPVTANRHWRRPEYRGDYGHFSPVPPDFNRCACSIMAGFQSSQCSRKAVSDPDYTGEPTRCKQHSRATIAAKAEAQRKRDKEREAQRDLNRHIREGKIEAIALIQSIAAGHNDPRSACLEFLDKYSELIPEKKEDND